MALTINTNVASLNAQRNLSSSQNDLNTSMQRLSSGLRINSAKDDAAGLAISDRMTSQIRGLDQAARNANDGISLAQTAEGAMQESTNILQRIRELAVQSANATNSAEDREALQAEVNQLKAEMQRIAESTTFNGLSILNGDFAAQQFQVGANPDDTIGFSIHSMQTDELGRWASTASNDSVNNVGLGSITAPSTAAALGSTNTVGNGTTDQDITITGGIRDPQTITIPAGSTAETIASRVNSVSDETGVSATAKTEVTLDTLTAAGTVEFAIGTASGDLVTVRAVIDDTSDLSDLASIINDQTGGTGITAVEKNGTITLEQSAGKDVYISDFTNSGGGTINVAGSGSATAQPLTSGGTNSTIISGEVEFSSQDVMSLESTITAAAGSIFGTTTGTTSTPDIAFENIQDDVDISTIDGANQTLKIVDKALGMIDSQRADLGAIQNRFESTISNLQNVSENLSAARSRIRDADIAQETSAMTQANILQQAGVSILTQANQTPQLALQLLQG